jgi:hypothetical protein
MCVLLQRITTSINPTRNPILPEQRYLQLYRQCYCQQQDRIIELYLPQQERYQH